jgi:23S rRNA (adenine2503-C2)-methyltransferase
LDPRNFSPTRLEEKALDIGLSRSQARKWLSSVLNKNNYTVESWQTSGIFSKKICNNLYDLPKLKVISIHKSTIDGFQKILFRTHDNLYIETVVIPLHKPGMVTICLSSQVGCVMACAFCATARMTKRRNLETWEIIDQFIQAKTIAKEEKKSASGVVFMGMGEPFLNYSNVISAASILSFPTHEAISAKAITISTVGLVSEIERFINERQPYRLSISIGAATDEKRNKLVPIAARTPVKRVMEAARHYAVSTKTRTNIAYVCISGVNVLTEDAIALSELVESTPIRLDLIDVNDKTGKYSPPTTTELSEFRDALRKYLKQPVVRRYSGGLDINAACGTLAGA